MTDRFQRSFGRVFSRDLRLFYRDIVSPEQRNRWLQRFIDANDRQAVWDDAHNTGIVFWFDPNFRRWVRYLDTADSDWFTYRRIQQDRAEGWSWITIRETWEREATRRRRPAEPIQWTYETIALNRDESRIPTAPPSPEVSDDFFGIPRSYKELVEEQGRRFYDRSLKYSPAA